MTFPAAASLAIMLGGWLRGDTVHQAMATKEYDLSNRRANNKLIKLGLISYNQKLDLATINENAVLDLLNQVSGEDGDEKRER